MIEKLYHTESYAEPINSIIKKVNEVICAQNKLELGTSAQQPLNAIALIEDLQEAICSNDIADPKVHDILMNRINAVLAQQQ